MASKICKIVISNFKGVTYQTVLTKDCPEFIFGKNGYGKTSIMEALRFGLLGKMPKDMLYHGASEGFVSIFFNDRDNTIVTRNFFAGDKPNKVKVNSKVTTAKEAQKVICEIMGCNEEKLDVLTSTAVFHELINGDLGKFLLSFITEPMTREKLYTLVEFTDAEKEKLNTDDLLPKKFDVSELDNIYQSLFLERKDLKKTIASYEARFDFEAVYPEPHYKTSDELKKAEEAYIEGRSKAKAITDSIKAYEKAVEAYNGRVEKKAALEKKLCEAPAFVAEATNETIEELDNNIRALVKEKHSFETIIASNKVIVDNQLKILDALDSDVCPIAACLKCKTDKTAAKSSIEEAKNAAEATIATANENIAVLSERIDAENIKLKALKTQLVGNRERAELERRISDIDIGDAPEMPTVETASDDWKMFPVYKQEFEEFTEFTAAKEAHAIMLNKLSVLNRLINAFSAKGEVNSAIMSHYCDLFNEEAETIASLFNYDVKFVPENGVKLSLIPDGKSTEVDFASLSTGEKLIASVIIYVVLNSLIGTGIIILDDFNDLDEENAKRAKDILGSVYRDLGMTTIFIAGCNEIE